MTDYLPLSEITELITKGTTPSTLGGGFVSSGINFVKVESISDSGKILKDKLAYIDEPTHAKLSRSILREDDILFSIAGAIGRTTRIVASDLPANTNQALAIIRVNKAKACVDYVHQCVQGHDFVRVCTDRSVKSAQANVSLGSMAKARMYLPPIAEQRKIAEILRTWDEAIEAAEAELKALQHRKRGLMQKLLSDSFGAASPVGKRTNHKLGEVGRFYSGLSGKTAADFGEGRPFISYNSVFGSSRCSAAGQPLVRVDADERQNQVKQWDIILTGSSETPDEVATSSMYCDAAEVYLNSFCIGYRYDHSRLEPSYAEHFFRGQDFRRAVWPLAQGSTRFNISREELAKVVISLPPLAEQRKIAEILHISDNNIARDVLRIEALRTQKRGLMQKLLTGEVRVAA